MGSAWLLPVSADFAGLADLGNQLQNRVFGIPGHATIVHGAYAVRGAQRFPDQCGTVAQPRLRQSRSNRLEFPGSCLLHGERGELSAGGLVLGHGPGEHQRDGFRSPRLPGRQLQQMLVLGYLGRLPARPSRRRAVPFFSINFSQFVRIRGRLALGLSYAGFFGSFTSSTILFCDIAFCT